jgi:Integrin beta chain VWA domain
MSFLVQVSPATNDLTLSINQTLAEVVKVTIPKSGVVPKVDVYFLADTTGSMNTAIAAVKGGIAAVMTQIAGLGADVQFGVGDYKDFPAPVANEHPYAFTHQQSLSAKIAEIKAAIDAWKTSPGKDTPEAQFYALDQLAEPLGSKIGWRTDSKRIIVWFGDAAGHDPVCKEISKLSYQITEQSLIAKLVAQKITVLALSMNTNYRAPQGLDDDPKTAASGYKSKCGEPGGTLGQGTRIANATGGKLVQGVSAKTIIETITAELAAQVTAIANVRLVASGATAPFVRAIAPISGYGPLTIDQEHEITFDVSWVGTVAATKEAQVFHGSLDVVADGEVVGGKTVTIRVPAIIIPVSPPPSGPYGRIPLIVELYDHHFTKNTAWMGDPGRRLLLTQDTPDLATPYQMADTVSSLKIRPGPDFDPNANYEVSFYRDPNYIGGQLVLKPGEYPDTHFAPIMFGDILSSVKFNQGVPPAPPVTSIPVVAELYSQANYGGRKLIILENVDNLATYSLYDNQTYSVKVFKGPNYTPGDKIRLYDTVNGSGKYIDLAPGEYPDLQKSYTFGYVISSTRFVTGIDTGSETVPAGSMEYAQIPLIVELYDHHFTKNTAWMGEPGRRLLLTQDTPDLATSYQMADTVSSLKIRPGPNFDPNANYEVSFYRDPNYIGGQLVLKPGEYPDTHFGPIWFGDIMSSVKFNQGVPPAPPVTPIPVVAELYSQANYGGRKLIILENVDNLATYSLYDNQTYSVKVFGGPNYTPGDKIRLYDTVNGSGKYIDLAPGEYPDLQKSHTFNYVVSSTRFIKE